MHVQSITQKALYIMLSLQEDPEHDAQDSGRPIPTPARAEAEKPSAPSDGVEGMTKEPPPERTPESPAVEPTAKSLETVAKGEEGQVEGVAKEGLEKPALATSAPAKRCLTRQEPIINGPCCLCQYCT